MNRRSLAVALALAVPLACTSVDTEVSTGVDAGGKMGGDTAARAPTATLRSELALLAPLCGRTWIAQFPKGGLSDTQTYEPMLGGQFIRNEHAVADASGKVVYSGETIY